MATVSDCSMLRGLKCAAIVRVHVVMTTCVDGKKGPEVICRGGWKVSAFLDMVSFWISIACLGLVCTGLLHSPCLLLQTVETDQTYQKI